MLKSGSHYEVLVIGTGFSGLCAAIKLKDRGLEDFVVVDKASGIGGTWLANRYPGAACDVPSHLYSFSFAPNPNWSHIYSRQPAILDYMHNVAERFDLNPHIQLGVEVLETVFDEAKGRWTIYYRDCAEEGARLWVTARFIINGMGGLHRPSFPAIPGRDRFAGKAMHTAQWDTDYDLSGKRVAVVGSAASAVQLIPKVAKAAAQVDIYQRTPNFIAPRRDRAYRPWERRLFSLLPFTAKLHRAAIFWRLDLLLFPLVKRPRVRARGARQLRRFITAVVRDKALQKALTPEYELGCKRILISDDFFPALNRENVDLLTTGIDSMDECGIVDGAGVHRPYDLIVYATGFSIQEQFFGLNAVGRRGVTLSEVWAEGVQAHRGVMLAGFPNYFLTTGPNTGVGTTSVIFMIERTTDWIMQAIDRARKTGSTLDVKPAAQHAYNDRITKELDETVWASGCDSWYKSPNGRIEVLYPGNATMFAREMRRPNFDELILETRP